MLNDMQHVIALLKNWNLKVDVREKYYWRFAIQKIIYLAQALGFPVRYCYNLYLKGPYSPSLTQDYYDHSQDVLNLETSYTLSEKDIQISGTLAKMMSPLGMLTEEDIRSNLSLLESSSTAMYLMRANPDLAEDEIFGKIKQLKPYLKDSIITIGINKVKELLFKPEDLTEDMKAELEVWDRIDKPGSS